jgi:hypothetical protein
MSTTPAFEIRLPGVFEDAFLYMGQLLAVRNDRTLLQANLGAIIHDFFPQRVDRDVAELYLLRNDLLDQEGTQALLRHPEVIASLKSFGVSNTRFAQESTWRVADDFSRVLPDGDVLDLHVYMQRLYVASDMGMLHVDLERSDKDILLGTAVKRTDAECLSVTARAGTVVASCGDEGILVSVDEFDELRGVGPGEHQRHLGKNSLRASWLGYHLINYPTVNMAEGYRSKRRDAATYGRDHEIISDIARDSLLLVREDEDERPASFKYNDYSTFFTRYDDGTYEVRQRNWAGGHLGKIRNVQKGRLASPISAHACRSGLVVETFDEVHLLNESGVSNIADGEAVTVRTFPNSRHYKNIIIVIEEDAIRLVSPLAAQT